MTIEKGAPWGEIAATPHDSVVAESESAVARAVAAGARHVVLTSGDLLRAVGVSTHVRAPRIGEPSLQLPCDVIDIVIDETTTATAVSSVVIGGSARPRLWVSAGGFLGRYNVAIRAHPNDGLLDALEFHGRLRVRDIMAIRRRMLTGSHLPHPLLSMHRSRAIEWPVTSSVDASIVDRVRAAISIDGRRFGRARRVSMSVRADAFILCVPTGSVV